MKGTSRQPAFVRSVLFEMALEQKAQGRRIAELRETKRWTQPIAADRVGVALRTYQDWEAGAARPRWPNLERLAHVFGVSVESLIGNEPLPGGLRETPELMKVLGDDAPAWAVEIQRTLDVIKASIDALAAEARVEEASSTGRAKTSKANRRAA